MFSKKAMNFIKRLILIGFLEVKFMYSWTYFEWLALKLVLNMKLGPLNQPAKINTLLTN